MKWLSADVTWMLPPWWATTLCMLLTFMPPGVFFGYSFVGSVLRGCLGAPGLTPLGYFVVSYPGAISVACLGTLFLRFCRKPSAWLAGISVLLLGALPFLGVMLVMAVLMMMIPLWGWGLILATVLGPIVLLWLVVRGETVTSASVPDPLPEAAP
jgi:hypothetical protein